MKKLLLVATGVGIGYVLGARAGRPAYDRLATTTRDLAGTVGLDRTRLATREVIADVRQSGERLRDKADDRIAETVDKVGAALPTTSTRGGDGTSADPTTPVAGSAEMRASDMVNGF